MSSYWYVFFCRHLVCRVLSLISRLATSHVSLLVISSRLVSRLASRVSRVASSRHLVSRVASFRVASSCHLVIYSSRVVSSRLSCRIFSYLSFVSLSSLVSIVPLSSSLVSRLTRLLVVYSLVSCFSSRVSSHRVISSSRHLVISSSRILLR